MVCPQVPVRECIQYLICLSDNRGVAALLHEAHHDLL